MFAPMIDEPMADLLLEGKAPPSITRTLPAHARNP